MNTVRIRCPKCDAAYQVGESAIGRSVQCNKCSAKFRVGRQAAGSPQQTAAKPVEKPSPQSTPPPRVEDDLWEEFDRERISEQATVEDIASGPLPKQPSSTPGVARKDWRGWINIVGRTTLVLLPIIGNLWLYNYLKPLGINERGESSGGIDTVLFGFAAFWSFGFFGWLAWKGIRFGGETTKYRIRGFLMICGGVAVIAVTVFVIATEAAEAGANRGVEDGHHIRSMLNIGVFISVPLLVVGIAEAITGLDLIPERFKKK